MSSLTANAAGEPKATAHAAVYVASLAQDSALDLGAEHLDSSRDAHYLTATVVEGIRRRGSEYSRPRPTDLAQTPAIELVPIPSLQVKTNVGNQGHSETDGVLKMDTTDIELASIPGLPQSTAASLLNDGDSISAAPILTTAQKVAQRRWSVIHLAAACWSFFLAGWNDGSTGPLLPKIQLYHKVSYTR